MSYYDKDHLGVGGGWRKLVEPLIDKCKEEGVEIHQIKEKFGGLRFYTGGGESDELLQMINKAEADAEVTCETCGEPGEITGPGWLKATCGKHSK